MRRPAKIVPALHRVRRQQRCRQQGSIAAAKLHLGCSIGSIGRATASRSRSRLPGPPPALPSCGPRSRPAVFNLPCAQCCSGAFTLFVAHRRCRCCCAGPGGLPRPDAARDQLQAAGAHRLHGGHPPPRQEGGAEEGAGGGGCVAPAFVCKTLLYTRCCACAVLLPLLGILCIVAPTCCRVVLLWCSGLCAGAFLARRALVLGFGALCSTAAWLQLLSCGSCCGWLWGSDA